MACEQALPLGVLETLSPRPALSATAWLKRMQTEGWVVNAGPLRTGSLKPHFAVHPDYRELVLRQIGRAHV